MKAGQPKARRVDGVSRGMCGACDRAAAREARKAARELLLSRGVAISPSCPLHPDNDRLLPHERRKKTLGRAQWQCAQPLTKP